MPVQNSEIADIFDSYADLLEIQGANQFRVRAYRTAARTVSNLSRSLADMLERGENPETLPGIGKDLAGKITEIVHTGKLAQLEEIKTHLPPGLVELTGLAGVGPKRASVLYRELGITDFAKLEEAARENRIRDLPGFAARTQEKILDELERRKGSAEEKRFRLQVVQQLAGPLLTYLEKVNGVRQVEAAGSYRRGRETVHDLDILVTHTPDSDVMERFVNYEDTARVIARGETRSTIVLRAGLHVDVRAVPEESYGAALHYFTGSKAHNVAVRRMGVKLGLKINEYGVFRGEERIAGRTEEEVYRQVGLPYIEPELCEDRGEIDAALEDRLPTLLKLDDIRGDLHAHTDYTEGRASLEQMAKAAKAAGYEYLAVTDHSKRLSMTHGLDEKRLGEQIDEIDRLNAKTDGFTVLKGIEVDILDDGTLDLSNDILKELDLLVCSVHHRFGIPRERQTERVLRALDISPVFTILGHPTGRLIGEREPYEIDLDRIMDHAAASGCALELNAQPKRLDLDDIHCQAAKEKGVIIAISTDSHSTEEFRFMQYGVLQARRGWLEANDVINTLGIAEVKDLLRKSRK